MWQDGKKKMKASLADAVVRFNSADIDGDDAISFAEWCKMAANADCDGYAELRRRFRELDVRAARAHARTFTA